MLVWEDRVIGVIALGTFGGKELERADLSFLMAVSRPIAVALGNARLHDALARNDAVRIRLLDTLVTAEDADLIADLVRRGPVKMKLTLTPQHLPDVESYNIIGDIKGSEHAEQVIIVSGHLDSWDLGTGAIDDAAGVAVSMEAVNLMQKLHLTPKRTIRVINIKGKPEVKKMLVPVAAILQESGAGMLNFVEHCGTDIEPLEKANVPAFSPIQDSRFYFNYHHTAADTLDKIVPKELAENSAVVTVLAYALANMEQPLPR